ncbi:MAG TPA: AAA family ATPase [Verrucomicrobiae bacterium]|nr:AAA family ATPase [Verrucomicrobiae bacterium]
MKKRSRRFWNLIALTIAIAGLASAAAVYYFTRPVAHDISHAQLELLMGGKLIHQGHIVPTPYAGIFHVQGTWQSGGKEQPFSITTHLDPEQLKSLTAQPRVVIELPGGGLKEQWVNIFSALVLIGLVVGLVAFQTGLGRGQHSRIRQRPTVRFSDVAGVEEAKAEIQEVVDFLRDPAKYRKLGGKLPKGVLLIGPPGTGKTLLAKAIAGEAQANFFSAHGSDFNEVFVGVGAKRVRSLFKQAAKHKPAIIFIDEIDCLGKNRKLDTNSELQQTNNALLAAMDGFESSEGIVVVAATNRPEDLDEALMRPGRFDRKVQVPYPDVKGRRAILQAHAWQKPIAEESALEIIAQTTPGMSGADLANLLNEAAILCAQQNREQIFLADLEASRDKVRFGQERKSMVLSQKERELIAYHEAGHALINLKKTLLPPLYKVSIIPRGQALGTTTLLPKEDQNIHSRDMLLQQLTVLMGGRAAEKTFLGATTNGASGDLEMARQLARKMVLEWGMGEKLYYEPQQREAEIEINRILAAADAEALAMIEAQKEDAERVAQALLARETLTREEVLELVAG